MTLKLDRLPDRETVKISFVASPELNAAPADYAEIYSKTYGRTENVTDLVPFMLEAFMNADPGFRRARTALRAGAPGPAQSKFPSTSED